MLKVAMLALSASLTVGAVAPEEAAAQSGRQRAEQRNGNGGVIYERRDSRVDERVIRDGRCYDNRRWNDGDSDSDSDSDRRKGGKSKSKVKNDHRDRDGRYDDCDDDYRRGDRNGNGPKFCRNGQGHPVHGMAWCREKGWGNGSLRNVRWEDVILRRPRGDVRSDLGRKVLYDILGRTVYGRFDQQRSRLGLDQSLTGRWVETQNGAQLNLFSGGVQLAQILDRNRDGRADVVRVIQ